MINRFLFLILGASLLFACKNKEADISKIAAVAV
jgi:hypothetical protein